MRTKAAEALGTVEDVRRYGRLMLILYAVGSPVLLGLAFVSGLPVSVLAVWLCTVMGLNCLIGLSLVTVGLTRNHVSLRGFGVTRTISPRDIANVLFGNGKNPRRVVDWPQELVDPRPTNDGSSRFVVLILRRRVLGIRKHLLVPTDSPEQAVAIANRIRQFCSGASGPYRARVSDAVGAERPEETIDASAAVGSGRHDERAG